MVGEVGPGNTRFQAPQLSVNPDQFGAGVGRALRGTAEAVMRLEDSQDNLRTVEAQVAEQYKQKEDKKRRADAEMRLIRTNAELDRGLFETRRDAAEGGEGYTNSAYDIARARGQEFLETLPPELQDEFRPRVESMVQGATNTAFDVEMEMEHEYFANSLGNTTDQFISRIKEGELTVDETLGELQGLIEASPLPKQQQAQLYYDLTIKVAEAQLARDAWIEAQHPEFGAGTTGGPADGSDVVAAGLPGAARGFLNGVAGPESGGAYNVMYGGETFEDYSRHPNQPRVITEGPNKGKTSTAAGRYQFLYTTWVEARDALGLPDFSPESQDRAAWWLAQRDYAERTGGRDLAADVNTGDYAVMANMRAVLAPTWDAFRTMSDEKFHKLMTGQAGTPSALMYNPAYANVPFDRRQAIIADAENFAATQRQEQATALNKQIAAEIDSLKFGILDGTAGMQQIETMRGEGKLTSGSYQELVGMYEDKYSAELGAQKFVSLATSGQFNPQDETHQKAASQFYNQAGAKIVQEQDLEGFTQTILPSVSSTGYIPPALTNQLSTMRLSTNPQTASFAMQGLSALQRSAPGAFVGTVPKETRDEIALFQQLAGFMTPEELSSSLADMRDPAKQQPRAAAKQEIRDYRKDNPQNFKVDRLVAETFDTGWGDSGPKIPMDSSAIIAFEAEFNNVYSEMYIKYRDHDVARNATMERLKQEWGRTSVGGRDTIMRYAPEMFTKPVDNSYDYMDTQVREVFEVPEGGSYILVSDAQTERDIVQSGALRAKADKGELTPEEKAGVRAPSYAVMLLDENGTLSAAGVEYDENGRAIQRRVFFDPQSSPEAAQTVEKANTEQQMFYAGAETQRLVGTYNQASLQLERMNRGIIPYDPAVEKQLKDAEDRLKELREEWGKEREINGVPNRAFNSLQYLPFD